MEQPRRVDTAVRVVTAGEALIDLIAEGERFKPCLGGAVYNFTRALARQGIGCAYLNPLSQDRFGRQLAAQLIDDGASLAAPLPVAQPTSLAVVALDAAGKADYAFYREGVADRAVTAASVQAVQARYGAVEVVCTGCLALAPDDATTYLPWIHAARAAGLRVVIDANLRPAVTADIGAYRDNVFAALTLADVIKVSDDDLLALGLNNSDPIAAATTLFARSEATVVAVTLGAQGAALLLRDGTVFRATEQRALVVVDTVGAGDCFLAGLIAAWLQSTANVDLAHWRDHGAAWLAHAVASASLCVQAAGCVPPDWAQARAWQIA